MEEKEYNEKLKKLESEYDSAKNKLHIEFALSNAKFKKGDIIKDTTVIILIDKVSVHIQFGLPDAVYQGIELKKDLTPTKKASHGAIYGHGHANNPVELIKSAKA